MSTTLTNLLVSCRVLSGDGSVDNLKRYENLNNAELGNVINGTNKTFNVSVVPMVVGGLIQVWADNTLVPPNQITPQETLGQFTLTNGPTSSLYASYYYNLFPDSVWQEFILAALERLSISTGDPATDVPNVAENYLALVKVFANAFFLQKVASQTGLWYNQRLQERVEDRDSISRKYADMADKAFKRGDAMYQAILTDRNEVPAFSIVEHQPLPFTPSR